MNLDLGLFGGSALPISDIDVPTEETEGIPVTYVPARNTVFLSFALAWAEVMNPGYIHRCQCGGLFRLPGLSS